LSQWTRLPTDLHAYHATFWKFKHVPPNLVYVKIGTSIRTTSATSHIFVSEQKEHVITEPTSPLRGGISLKIILMSIKIFVVPTKVITIEFVKGNIETIGENIEPIDISTTTNIIKPLKFLSTTLPLTPPQIGIWCTPKFLDGLKLSLKVKTIEGEGVGCIPVLIAL